MTNLEIFNSAESFTMTLNDAGKNYIKNLLVEYSKFSAAEIAEMNLEDWYDINNPDSDFDFMNEISGHHTKNGNPLTFTLSIENHFSFDIA